MGILGDIRTKICIILLYIVSIDEVWAINNPDDNTTPLT